MSTISTGGNANLSETSEQTPRALMMSSCHATSLNVEMVLGEERYVLVCAKCGKVVANVTNLVWLDQDEDIDFQEDFQ